MLAVVAAEDPGAARALAPVIRLLLSENRLDLSIQASDHAAAVFAAEGFDFSSTRDADGLFDRRSPAVLLAGTAESENSIDRRYLATAIRRRIRAFCLLDYWTNYVERFSTNGRIEPECLPDRIFVMDEAAKSEMVSVGFPAPRLDVTGQPHLDDLVSRRPAFSARDRERFRREIGVPESARLVTFACETFGWTVDPSSPFAAGPAAPATSERTLVVLSHVLLALAEHARPGGAQIAFVNKLHPKNSLSEFQGVGRETPPFPIQHMQSADTPSLIRSSDLVIGMTSMMMVEAACLGVPVISVLPDLRDRRIWPFFLADWPAARTPDELSARLREAFSDGRQPEAVAASIASSHAGATRRVVDRIYGELGL